MWLHSLKVAQLLRSAACLHTNQSRSYLNHLVYRSFQEHESLTLHDFLSTGHHLLVVSFITTLKSDICTALTTWNTAVNNCIILHAQNTTALQTCILNWNTPINHCSQAKDSRFSAMQATANVNCKLHSH